MMLKKILIVHLGKRSSAALKKAEEILGKNKIEFLSCDRREISQKANDSYSLILTIGGDGTFLRTSHYNQSVPQLGLNALPLKKEGFFARTTIPHLERDIGRIRKGDYSIINLSRLVAKINGKEVLCRALNEFYVGPDKAYDLFNYTLDVSGESEFQRSSGLLIGTAAGSYGWLKSAGGEEMPLESSEMQLLVREPYHRSLYPAPKILKKIISGSEAVKVKITSNTGLLIADSVGKEHMTFKDDVIEITKSDVPLKLVSFG